MSTLGARRSDSRRSRLAHWSTWLARATSEAPAAARALAPAWPAFLCATIAAVALVAPPQGRIALLIDASAPLLGQSVAQERALGDISEWADAASARGWVAIFAAFLFSLSMMVLALYAMSLRSPAPDEKSAKASEQERMPRDPVHPSVTLRLGAAKLAGLLAPAAMLLTLGSFLFQDSLLPPDAAWAVVGGALTFIILLALGLGRFAMWAEPSLFRMDRALRENANSWEESRQVRGGDRYERLKAFDALASKHRLGRIAWSEHWACVRSSAVSAFVFFFDLLVWKARRLVLDAVRWLLNPERMRLVGAAIGVGAFISGLALATVPLTPGETSAAPALQAFALTLIGAALAAALAFDWLRDKAMTIVGARDSRELIVDRRVQTRLRAVSFLIAALILSLFWSTITPASAVTSKLLGPTSALMFGLIVTASVLVWLVRNAITPPRVSPPPPRLRLRPFVGFPKRLSFWWLSHLGRWVEHFQKFANGQVIFGLGVWFALISWPFLWLARLAVTSLPENSIAGAWVLTILIAVGSPAWCAWRISRLVVSVFGSGAPKTDPAAGTTLPPRTALLPTPILILPFLLSGLGENLEPDRFGRVERAPRAAIVQRSMEEHARAWLTQAAARAGSDEPIPAIIILAEGGGVRAASHSGALLVALDEPSPEGGRGLFADVYAISAVSGGAIGTADFLAAKAMANSTGCGHAVSLERPMSRLLAQDELTPLVIGLFASDFPSAFVPFNLHIRLQRIADPAGAVAHPWPRIVPNRGDFFELALRRAGREISGTRDARDWFDGPLSSVVAAAAACDGVSGLGRAPGPIIFFGTFGADSQIRAAASNVDFGDCSALVPGEFVSVDRCRGAVRDLSLVSGAHISARFPLSNPPSTIMVGEAARAHTERFVDGGYFDNSGAAIARDAVRALRDAAQRDNLGARLRIVVIHVFVREPPVSAESFPVLNEISAPYQALWSARQSSALIPVSSLCSEITDGSVQCNSLSTLRMVSVGKPAESLVQSSIICADGAPAWLSAPLDNSANEITPEFFPLGWLLRPESHAIIAERQGPIAQRLRASLALVREAGDSCGSSIH